MIVKQLIEQLSQFNDDDEVVVMANVEDEAVGVCQANPRPYSASRRYPFREVPAKRVVLL